MSDDIDGRPAMPRPRRLIAQFYQTVSDHPHKDIDIHFQPRHEDGSISNEDHSSALFPSDSIKRADLQLLTTESDVIVYLRNEGISLGDPCQ